MKSFKLRKADLLLLAAALVFGAVLAAVLLLLRSPGGTVQVRVAGTVTAGYPLDVDASYTITGANGGTNLLVIEDGAARIEEASCPDGVCVHTGRIYWLSGLVQKKLLHRKKQFRLPERAVRWGQKVKYLLLVLIAVLCALGVYGKLTGTSPWDVFSRLTALKLPAAGYGAGIALFVLILIGMAAQPRFFCQFLCPMGAVFALLPVLPFAWLHRNGTRCIPGCSACARRCPVDLKLDDANLRGGECIACEACVGTCPKGNISRWDIRLSRGKRWLPVLVKAALFFALGVCLGLCRFISVR